MPQLEQALKLSFEVTDTELSEIARHFVPHSLDKGDFLVKSGRVCNQLVFLSSGILRIYAQAKDKEVTQWISTSNYFVTDLASFVFKTPARWNIQALTDCELFVINSKEYNNLCNIIPRWHQIEKLFISKCFIIMEDRIFSHLSMSAEERFQQLIAYDSELFNYVPLQYLASMLGMTPETLSRLRKKTMQ